MSNTNGKRRSLSQTLLGTLEIALFMPRGAKRFGGSVKEFKKSFLIPLMILPLTLITVLAAHPSGNLAPETAQILMAIYSLRLFVYLGLFIGIVYFMAKSLDRLDGFHRFVVANNWLTLPAAVLTAPLLIAFMNGYYSWAEVYPLMVMITLYSYAYTAFMAVHVLRVPWEMAAFIMVMGMAIHQTSLDVLKWAAMNTVYLIS
jgi:hypothetical protein